MRTALVTGASRGIGRGIAESLARQGFGLSITSRDPDDLVSAAARLTALGAPNVVHQATDMADRNALRSLVDHHAATFQSMNALVLNAGVGTAGPIEGLSLARIDKTIEVNLVSAMILLKSALPLLRRGAASDAVHGATVVGLSSITGAYAEPGLAVYGATKAALMSLLNSINLEESGNGVKATALAPAYVATDMSRWTTDKIPAETMLQVNDVVAVVDMLLSLGRTACIPTIVMTRGGSSGFSA